MYKGYKVRIYPTEKQEEILWEHIHACRFIWNYMLELQENRYKNGEKHLSYYEMNKLLSPLKNQEAYMWLKKVSHHSLFLTCNDLSKAYKDFFKGINGCPKFKSKKKDKLSYPIRYDVFRFDQDGNAIIERVKHVKTRKIQMPQGKIVNPRVSFVNHKWILSFGVECENQVVETTDIPMGIDLGIKELAVVSYGNQKFVFHNINKSKRVRTLEHKLKHVQRVLNRKYRENNYEKTKGVVKYEQLVKDIYCRLANIRCNYIHQTTHKIVSLRPNRIVMEDLDIMRWMKKKHLVHMVTNQCFGFFLVTMKYKCEWNGIPFIRADKWFASSKICSNCGNIKPRLALSQRVYVCEKCGLKLDRDYNAAINLMRYVPQNERVTT